MRVRNSLIRGSYARCNTQYSYLVIVSLQPPMSWSTFKAFTVIFGFCLCDTMFHMHIIVEHNSVKHVLIESSLVVLLFLWCIWGTQVKIDCLLVQELLVRYDQSQFIFHSDCTKEHWPDVIINVCSCLWHAFKELMIMYDDSTSGRGHIDGVYMNTHN
jgi:hypothetical protein